MKSRIPRLTIIPEGRYTSAYSRGSISLLSVGLGLFQAWWLLMALDGGDSLFPLGPGMAAAPCTLLCMLVSLAIMILTDQRLLQFYTSHITLIAASILAAGGSVARLACPAVDAPFALLVCASALIGGGAALLLSLWGVAFSRQNMATVTINACLSIIITFFVVVFVWALPRGVQAAAVPLLPLLCLPLLLSFTPPSSVRRHTASIFTPLPVNVSFLLRLMPPAILVGVALDIFLQTMLYHVLPDIDLQLQTIMVMLGSIALVFAVLPALFKQPRIMWDWLSRVLIAIIALCAVFLPFDFSAMQWASLPIAIGLMATGLFAWLFGGNLSQIFRLSPVLVFSTVHSGIAIGCGLWTLVASQPEWLAALPYGVGSKSLLAVTCITVAHAILPRAQDIKRTIIPAQESPANNATTVSEKIQQIASAVAEGGYGDATRANAGRVPNDGGQRGADLRVDGRESADGARGANADNPKQARLSRIQLRCDAIAKTYMLSHREAEVLHILAATGYNTNRVMDELYVSRSTVKTHIAHIYHKMQIHSRQELQAIMDADIDDLWGENG